MSDDPRIQQFKQMAEADPDNELGHFSLGKAYLDAGRFADAVEPLARTLELNANLSKGYQLLAEAHDKAGQRDKAIEVLTRGVTVADSQGDRKPLEAMVAILREWGAPVPTFQDAKSAETSAAAAGTAVSGFQCSRCGRPNGPLEKAPFKGADGVKILENVCANCWREWIPMGTKVINELGLVLSTTAGQKTYDQYMFEFLQLEER